MGRYAPGSTMFARAIEGIEIIEGAVRRDPENIVLRKIRLSTATGCPRLFHRTAAAISDFQYLAAQFRAGSKEIDSGSTKDPISWETAICGWERAPMPGSGMNPFLNPNSPYAEAARKQLHQHLPKNSFSPEMEDIDDLLIGQLPCSVRG